MIARNLLVPLFLLGTLSLGTSPISSWTWPETELRVIGHFGSGAPPVPGIRFEAVNGVVPSMSAGEVVYSYGESTRYDPTRVGVPAVHVQTADGFVVIYEGVQMVERTTVVDPGVIIGTCRREGGVVYVWDVQRGGFVDPRQILPQFHDSVPPAIAEIEIANLAERDEAGRPILIAGRTYEVTISGSDTDGSGADAVPVLFDLLFYEQRFEAPAIGGVATVPFVPARTGVGALRIGAVDFQGNRAERRMDVVVRSPDDDLGQSTSY
jgi:hypothetical protein